MDSKGFLAKMFDMSFSTFVTPTIIRVIFVIGIVLVALWALAVPVMLSDLGGGAAAIGLILAPIVFVLGVLMVRVYMEIIIVLFKIAENTGKIADHVGKGGQLD